MTKKRKLNSVNPKYQSKKKNEVKILKKVLVGNTTNVFAVFLENDLQTK